MKYLLIILFIIIIALLAAGYYTFMTVFDSHYVKEPNADPDYMDSEKDKMRPTARRLEEFQATLIPKFEALPFESLEITSFDGLRLHGDLLRGNPKEVVICVHGYRSDKRWDFCDKYRIYRDRGSTMLFVNDRAHGKSEGRYIGFSELDRFDVARWVDKINEMYDSPRIYLHGVSMGAATVVHCADMKLKNVCGIVEDCAFDSIVRLCQTLCMDIYHVPYYPVGYFSQFWAHILAHIDYSRSDGRKCVRNTDIPMVFIHGLNDNYIPYTMSKEMYEACRSPKELHLIDDCGHAAAYMRATEEYTAAVNRLLDGKIK